MADGKLKRLTWLFFINLFISSFTFGGGYVVIPMIRKYFVQKKKYLSEEEVMELAAISQSSPGAIAVNLSTLAGYKTAGMAGAAVSCIASVIPALLILSVISAWYAAFSQNQLVGAVLKGMEAGVAALIVDLIIDMVRMVMQEKSLLLTAMIPAAFISSFFLNINVAVILIFCCVICIGTVWLKNHRSSRQESGTGA